MSRQYTLSNIDRITRYIKRYYNGTIVITDNKLVFIAKPAKGFIGCFIQVYDHTDQYLDTKGKIRTSSSIKALESRLDSLDAHNYNAASAIGFNAAKKVIDWYLTE